MRILGYQAFYDSGEIKLSPGINLIVGQNNSGKSSILKALSSEFYDVRHKEPGFTNDSSLRKPEVLINVDMSGQELRETMGDYQCPLVVGSDGGDIIADAKRVADNPELSISLKRYPGESEAFFVDDGPFSCGELIYSIPRNSYLVKLSDGELVPIGSTTPESAGQLYGFMWLRRSFYFSAQRYSFSRGKVSYQDKLDPSCRNLPSVLHTLMTTRTDLFDKLVSHMREIFQTVGNLSVGPVVGEDGEVEVRVWPTSSRQNRELSFPLDACGTGIGQTLSLLTAIMTTKDSVILIDEINSYLHSSAVKSLIRIIKKDYGNHQYLISTHAPDVIGSFIPDSMFIVKKEEYRSSVVPLNAMHAASFEDISKELGISLTDVFGADKVVWVEGETEEICFPKLYEFWTKDRVPTGVKFISVCATGDLIKKGKKVDLVFEIYRKLAAAGASILSSSRFSFDAEALSQLQIQDAVRGGGGLVSFIPARCIECYVLSKEAILHLLNAKSGGLFDKDLEYIELVMLEKAREIGGSYDNYGDLIDFDNRIKSDAARIITRTVATVSEGEYQFLKKTDTLVMFEYMMSFKESEIESICEYIFSLVQE